MTQQNFDLSKGDKFDLSKSSSLRKLTAIASWTSPPRKKGEESYDVDLSIFGLKNGVLHSRDYFVYYNHEQTENSSIVKSPDERSGGVETAIIDIDLLPADLDEVTFVLTLHEETKRHQTLREISDAKIEIYDDESNLVCTYKFADAPVGSTSLRVASICRTGDKFEFVALGEYQPYSLKDWIGGWAV